MSTKRQQTMAKLTRERKVKERRALKLEKKQAAAAERKARAADGSLPATGEVS
jgi:cell division protein FtsB